MHRKISISSLLLIVALTVLLILGGPACSSCSDTADYRFKSTVVSGHSHEIKVSDADIQNPPDQRIIETTSSSGHTHTITLTSADYEALKDGQQITVTSSSVDGHTHTFNIGTKIIIDIDTAE